MTESFLGGKFSRQYIFFGGDVEPTSTFKFSKKTRAGQFCQLVGGGKNYVQEHYTGALIGVIGRKFFRRIIQEPY